jgi:hypothetical protein
MLLLLLLLRVRWPVRLVLLLREESWWLCRFECPIKLGAAQEGGVWFLRWC